jgi:hypothetical protein
VRLPLVYRIRRFLPTVGERHKPDDVNLAKFAIALLYAASLLTRHFIEQPHQLAVLSTPFEHADRMQLAGRFHSPWHICAVPNGLDS